VGVKQLLLVFVVVMGQSVLALDKKPLIADPIVDGAIRKAARKPTGELTEADLSKVTVLDLAYTPITDAGLKEMAKLQQLTTLYLTDTKITKAGVAELKKALPKCKISHDAKK
jgi:hypothetical protein